ncbi:MAG: NOB1 family endonuclease [Thermoprotei archaeon]
MLRDLIGKHSSSNSTNSEKIILIFDTTAFLAKYHLQLWGRNIEIYTTQSVVNEVRDSESKSALELGLSIARINILEPQKTYLEKVKKNAFKLGVLHKLSKTDLEVAALALELSERGRKVVVVTDDYMLQNLLLDIGIGFKPLRTTGIKKLRRYKIKCPVCGYTSIRSDEEICPICGYRFRS